MATSESEAERSKIPRKATEMDIIMQILSTPSQSNRHSQQAPAHNKKILTENSNTIDLTLDQAQLEPNQHQNLKSDENLNENSMVLVSAKDLNSILKHVRAQEHLINEMAQNLEKQKIQIKIINEALNNINDNTNRLNNKIDAIAVGRSDSISNIIETPILKPIDNEDQLKQLENDAKNVKFVQNVVKQFGTIFGKFNDGSTISLQLIYKLFTKEFLTKCSWTGGTRSAGWSKVAFKKHPHVIDLFFKIVQFCDSTYTYINTVTFLQNRIKSQSTRHIQKIAGRKRKANGYEVVENVIDVKGTSNEVIDIAEEVKYSEAVGSDL